ncbi:MAG: MucB/RseB C-terminal domain-containing protein [Halioglobus sp.]
MNRFKMGTIGVWLMLSHHAFANNCPGADSEAIGWLDKMSRSAHQVSYHGVVTYQRGGEDMQVMQVSHSVENGTTSETMTQLTGQGAKVVRAEHPLECVHPGHKLLRIGDDIKLGNCGVAEHYRFSVADGDRVAGRKAVRIIIAPTDMYRYGYVMELDRKTGLLLKTATIGRGNKVLEKFQFANLSFKGVDLEGADINLVHEAQHPVPGDVPKTKTVQLKHAWGVKWLPSGFTATDSQQSNAGRKTFTDGLSVFSVFIEELDREIRPGEGVAHSGSTTSYSRGMHLSGEPVLITVVGEVPVNTARMVADSVNWVR